MKKVFALVLMAITLASGCYRPRAPLYGSVRVYGSVALYSCNSGYTLSRSGRARCYSNRWSPSSPPRCVKRYVCPRLSSPSFGTVSVSGAKATYRCNSGYKLIGSPRRYCKIGKWQGSQPRCNRFYTCPRLYNPSYGSVTVFGTTATYRCNSGYRLIGSPRRYCKIGKWQGSQPRCNRFYTCPRLYNPSYGSVTVSGTTATYRCNSGYKLIGSPRRYCKIGKWQGSQPRCNRSYTCPRLYNPSYGSVTVSGTTATYRCNSGYRLNGNFVRICISGKGWLGTKPTCSRISSSCSRLSNPLYGNVTISSSGIFATYRCNSGYRLSGAPVRICCSRRWLGSQPSCNRIITSCPSLSHPSNGRVAVVGSRATYTCNSGYRLGGSSVRICILARRWLGSPPTCTQNCTSLQSPPNGQVTISGTTATYTCNAGFRLVGASVRTCTGGSWQGSQPICQGITPPSCTNGQERRDSCNQLCTCVNNQWSCCRQRKEFASMTTDESRLYVQTVVTAATQAPFKADYEALLRIHQREFSNGIHTVNQFLPWHRWFILQYENILRRVDCNVTVPYWDWSLVWQDPFSSPIWGSEVHHLGGDGTGSPSCVRTGPFRTGVFSLPTGQCLNRDFFGTFPGPVEVARLLAFTPAEFASFELMIRINLHDSVHCLIDGTMCTSLAGYAPEFFLHHGFIDKLWNDWQKKSTAHKNARFSTINTPMTATGGATPAQFVDIANQPGNVNVCYEEPGLGGVVIESQLRKLGVPRLLNIPRKPMSKLSTAAMDLFNVSDDERKKAQALDTQLRASTTAKAPNLRLSMVKMGLWNPRV